MNFDNVIYYTAWVILIFSIYGFGFHTSVWSIYKKIMIPMLEGFEPLVPQKDKKDVDYLINSAKIGKSGALQNLPIYVILIVGSIIIINMI